MKLGINALDDDTEQFTNVDRLVVYVGCGIEFRAIVHNCTHFDYCVTLSTMPITEIDGSN